MNFLVSRPRDVSYRVFSEGDFGVFGLSGLRSAALPLPLGVFKPSERYCWPLSPSSSLRFAWNKRVQLLVAGHVDNRK